MNECDNLSPPLADIVYFRLLPIVVNIIVLKPVFKICLFLSPIDVGSHNESRSCSNWSNIEDRIAKNI